jgi:hypothetical protein
LFDISGSYKYAFSLCIVSLAFSTFFIWIAAPRKAVSAEARIKD